MFSKWILRRFAGSASIFASSGGKGRNYKSKQGKRVLDEVIKGITIRQIAVTREKKETRNPYFYRYYEEKMAAGKTKQQAIVCIMHKLVSVLNLSNGLNNLLKGNFSG